jgi:hypothetical protein
MHWLLAVLVTSASASHAQSAAAPVATAVGEADDATDGRSTGCINRRRGCEPLGGTVANQARPTHSIPAPDKGAPRGAAHPGSHDMATRPRFKVLTASDIVPGASNFDTTIWLSKNSVPKSAAPDVVGAFRFICNISHSNHDDPIVYPGEPGKAHLHGYFGNSGTDAYSTYETLRARGDGSCQGGALNRSAYWKPELLDGAGQIVREDHVVVYYKRRPSSDPRCAIEGKACVGIPPGLRTIFGTNYSTAADPSPHVAFRCNGPSGDDSKHPYLGPAAANCAPGNKILATVHTPRCWDGTNLDSPDHQSHLAYQRRDDGRTGKYFCPSTHPYIIPEVTLTFVWPVLPGDEPTEWRFSSDIVAGKPAGATFHSDYMEAWDPAARLAWEGACLDKLLNCSDGNLGDGRKLKRPPGFTFQQRSRKKPVHRPDASLPTV